ncbi:hypothetical protein [Arenibaculum sp.]|jgi:hypothetical protein|uniref:hypothetical protein n=1 Tax=Arenibaculum sp. TaxID=2865862 RepID=UPI002E12BAF9|nr:hypothetical protein [Arenibaculum sp.]
MNDRNITDVLRAVERGLVRHAHPFTWECEDEAIDPRTLQRALQQNLIGVEANADREPHLVTLTERGREKLSREG